MLGVVLEQFDAGIKLDVIPEEDELRDRLTAALFALMLMSTAKAQRIDPDILTGSKEYGPPTIDICWRDYLDAFEVANARDRFKIVLMAEREVDDARGVAEVWIFGNRCKREIAQALANPECDEEREVVLMRTKGFSPEAVAKSALRIVPRLLVKWRIEAGLDPQTGNEPKEMTTAERKALALALAAENRSLSRREIAERVGANRESVRIWLS